MIRGAGQVMPTGRGFGAETISVNEVKPADGDGRELLGCEYRLSCGSFRDDAPTPGGLFWVLRRNNTFRR